MMTAAQITYGLARMFATVGFDVRAARSTFGSRHIDVLSCSAVGFEIDIVAGLRRRGAFEIRRGEIVALTAFPADRARTAGRVEPENLALHVVPLRELSQQLENT